MWGEAAGKHGNLGQSTLPNSCAPTTYTETGGPDLAKWDWAVTKGWGCYIDERWVIFYQMLYLGYEWIRSWFGSKTYPMATRQRWGIAHKPRSNWIQLSTGNCLKETACTAKCQLAFIQQSIISLNSRVYLSQSHLFHMFFTWRIRSLQLPLLNIPHCDILMFHPCPRWDELPVCTPLCNVDSLRHQPGMRILQALTVKRQFDTLQKYSQLSRQLLGDDSGIYLMNHYMDTVSRVWFYITHWT